MQTFALPLGHGAIYNFMSYCSSDSYGNRTRVTAVKGRCLDRLTKEPYLSSPSWTRTNDTTVNSRVLYRLSYGGTFLLESTLRTFKTTYTTHPFFISMMRLTTFAWLVTCLLYNSLSDLSSLFFLFSNLFLPNTLGQTLDRLVTVSYTHYCASTSALSTSSSSRGLTSFEWDISS